MRSIISALTATLAVSIMMTTAGFAAAKLTPAQKMEARDRAKDPRSFDRCVELAKQRGESINELDYRDRARAFVRGCMQGKYR